MMGTEATNTPNRYSSTGVDSAARRVVGRAMQPLIAEGRTQQARVDAEARAQARRQQQTTLRTTYERQLQQARSAQPPAFTAHMQREDAQRSTFT